MNVNGPISLVVASYDDLDGAARDFRTVWSARADGDFHHTSVAILRRDPDDELQIELSDNTAKYLVWGGALMGAALFMLAPAAGVRVLTANGLSGAGAIMGHIRMNADPRDLADAAQLVDTGRTSLVVMTVNRRGEDMTGLLDHPIRTSSVDMLWGDLEEELCQDFAKPLSEAVLFAM
jgi:hypothetical protein